MSIERDETIAALRAEVADGRAEIHRLQTRCDMLDVSAEVRKAELAALVEARATITQLQARGTELVLERRNIDRRAQVREFFAAVGQAMPERPGVPDEASLRLGLRLIAEEVTEIFEAVFGQLPPSLSALFQDLIRLPLAVDLPDVIDGIVDAQYVLEGLAIRCGVDLRPVWTEVHASNLRKAGGPKDEHGKIQKPAGWVAPDVAVVLRDQGWTGGER